MTTVQVSKLAHKQLAKAPHLIQSALVAWIDAVENQGLLVVQSLRSYRDKALQGQRQGQRSIRLNKQWRAIYRLEDDILTVTVLEVTPHDYRTR
jgi:proteic killer suppression protein